MASGLPPEAVIKTVSASFTRIEYEFWGERFSYSTIAMFFLALFVGVIGGTYGIGGGAIIAPFCVAVFHLPVYTIAGAALIGDINNFSGRGNFLQHHSRKGWHGHFTGLAPWIPLWHSLKISLTGQSPYGMFKL